MEHQSIKDNATKQRFGNICRFEETANVSGLDTHD
jgi:hypothetical protein